METLLDFITFHASRYRDNIYLWENRGSGYTGVTYGMTLRESHRFAAGLLSHGVRKGDRVALLSEGRNEWVWAEFGILFAGAVCVPLSVRMEEPEEIRFRLDHSGARIAVVSGRQCARIRSVRAGLPDLEQIILLDEVAGLLPGERMFVDVCSDGDRFLAGQQAAFDGRVASVGPDDPATISYTSGTTAVPKGIILTHRNYLTNIGQAYSLMDISEDFTTLLILPWDHAFAHTAGIYCFLGKGASIAAPQGGNTAVEAVKNLPKNIREVRPSLLFTVPAIARNFRRGIERSVQEKGALAGFLFRLGLRIAYAYQGTGWDRGKSCRFLLKPFIRLFDRLLFRQIRNGFGGRLQFFIGGGALLDIEFQRFFYALGIPMLQGYGLTEAAPLISANSLHMHKLGSSGLVVKGLEIAIRDEKRQVLPAGAKGEITVRGGNVMAGYWHNEEATREALQDGWLHTGDLGYVDLDGFLYVLGRFKSLLIADDGEKYSPEGMEEAFTAQSLYIDQCMLYNDQQPYTVLLLVAAVPKLKEYLQHEGLSPDSQQGREAVLIKLEREIHEYRKGGRYHGQFPQRWLPGAIALLEEGFSETNHLLNFQMKIVRSRIVEKHASRIRFLYSPAGKSILNEQNLEAIQSLLSPQ